MWWSEDAKAGETSIEDPIIRSQVGSSMTPRAGQAVTFSFQFLCSSHVKYSLDAREVLWFWYFSDNGVDPPVIG